MAGNWIRRLFGINEDEDNQGQLALPNPAAAQSRTATDITVLDLEGRGTLRGSACRRTPARSTTATSDNWPSSGRP